MRRQLFSVQLRVALMIVGFLAWNFTAGIGHGAPITVTATPSSFVIAVEGSIMSTLSATDENPPGSAKAIWKFEADAPGSVFNNTLTAYFKAPGDYTINVRAYVSYDGGLTWSEPGTTTVSVIAIAVSFSTNPINVAVGGTAPLTATVTPSSGEPYVSFATTDPGIATVTGTASALAVHGVSTGQTQLQATVNSQVCAWATVNVIAVTFSPSPFYVWEGDSDFLMAMVTPGSASGAVVFSSLDTKIATVSGNAPSLTVTGVAAGITQVVGEVGEDLCGSVDVYVVTISYDPDPLDVAEGDSEEVNVTVTPEAASSALTFTPENSWVASADWAAPILTVSGLNAGETDIVPYLKGKAGKKKLKVTVIKVVFTPDPVIVVADGGTAPVTATVTPLSAKSKITFDTDDSTVATVAGTAPDLTVTGGVYSSTTWLNGILKGKKKWKVQVINVRVSLKEVSFSENHELVSDDGATTFDAPQWRNTVWVVLGFHIPLPDRRYPVAYTRNTQPKLEAKFLVTPALPGGTTVKVKANASGGVKVPETVAAINGTEVTMPATWANAGTNFDNNENKIRILNTFDITWEMKINNLAYTPAGTSNNKVYLTYNTPGSTPIIHTVIHVGCDAAGGLGGTLGTPSDVAVLDAVWTKFQTKAITRVSDGKILSYYGFRDNNGNGTYDAGVDDDLNFPNPVGACTATTAEDLIKERNGQCGSWADFMIQVMKAQGLGNINGNDNQYIHVVIGGGWTNFAVKNWAKNPAAGAGPWIVINATDGADADVRTAAGTIAVSAGVTGAGARAPGNGKASDQAGVPGQGHSPNPPYSFANHVIVRMNNRYYDPSYALGGANGYSGDNTGLRAYEAEAMEGPLTINIVTGGVALHAWPAGNPRPLICTYTPSATPP